MRLPVVNFLSVSCKRDSRNVTLLLMHVRNDYEFRDKSSRLNDKKRKKKNRGPDRRFEVFMDIEQRMVAGYFLF